MNPSHEPPQYHVTLQIILSKHEALALANYLARNAMSKHRQLSDDSLDNARIVSALIEIQAALSEKGYPPR